MSPQPADAVHGIRFNPYELTLPLPTPRHRRAGRTKPGAGLLIRHVDAEGAWWLLALRCPDHGGRWANLGGAIDRGETPHAAALRELAEETELTDADFGGLTLRVTLDTSPPGREYVMFVADAATASVAGVLGWEHDDLAWFPTASVDELAAMRQLHPQFAAAWDLVPTHLKEA